MNTRHLLHAVLVISALALASCATSSPVAASQPVPLGVDLGASNRIAAGMPDTPMRADGGRGAVRLAQAGQSDAHASGVVNSVDPQRHTVNISHQAITSIGWPPMTMDFSVAPSVSLGGIAPGTQVDFTLRKGSGGMYQVESIRPAKRER